jgi:hypothetical protein
MSKTIDAKRRDARQGARARDLEHALEEGLMATFPCSDPIAVTEPASEPPWKGEIVADEAIAEGAPRPAARSKHP